MREKQKNLRRRAEELLVAQRSLVDTTGKSADELLQELLIYQAELEIQNQELIEAEQELEASRLQYLELFRSLPLACFTLTERGIIGEANPAAERLFGLPDDRLRGYPITLLVHPDDHSRFFTALGRLRRGDEWTAREFAYTGAAGVIDGRTDCRRVHLPRAEAGDVLVTILDVSQRKKLERELRVALRTKERFLAATSHDLRQPVQALLLLVDRLARHALDPSARDVVGQMMGSVGALAAMLDSLLDMSRLDAGVLKPAMAPVPLAPMMRRLHNEFAPLAEQKGLRLTTLPSGMIGSADPVMLERICRNLLSNAIRYTRQGRIVFGARRQEQAVRLEVWDTGIGIKAGDIDRMFEDFAQVGDHARNPHEGLGLGLAISKRLIEALGGTISVRSRVGKGSCFAITLPMATSEAPLRTDHAENPCVSERPTTLPGRHILLVEDEAIIRVGLESCLSDWGYLVASYESGDEALAAVTAGLTPDLLLTDYRLPGGFTGLDLIDAVRARVGSVMPGIILSGDTELGRLLAMTASGCHLLHKPFMPDKLRAAIEAAFASKPVGSVSSPCSAP
ncbi:ATP-binding response regulator [Azospirillum rugosum]|uniref:histidine kinase n=1 Tax=Azospirillum rugosum TaxID=416170 RepID=A0ABS4SP62_9PROT|nr:ATP-binding protein [Azospirillum rugosum]MBP2294343.1 PAS domain S-box-containing protein [Azospirillum rugosum]MDQ0527678.1 PAS domain S-box-containing protein [Azospirillum rugosum]